MENKFFRPAGNLIDEENTENKFFMPAGDLTDDKSDLIYPKKVEDTLTPFRNPGDLDMGGGNFKPAGDLDSGLSYENKYFRPGENLTEEINDYLLTVVNGKKESVCELGVLKGAGRMVVDLEQLKRMVDEGHNIVSAKVINAEIGLIEIEFQRYEYDEEIAKRWRRF